MIKDEFSVANHIIICINKLAELHPDEDYVVDYYKLNKLMYLAQIKAWRELGEGLFDDELIEEKSCGAVIDGLEVYFHKNKFRPIETPIGITLPVSDEEEQLIQRICQIYGNEDKAVLANKTKTILANKTKTMSKKLSFSYT